MAARSESGAAADSSLPGLTDQARAELLAVLAEPALATTRIYYDAATDRSDTDRYYAGVELDGLAKLVTDTHRDRPRCLPATELYPWVRPATPNTSIPSLYTGESYDPAQLINADFRIAEQRHTERTRIGRGGGPPGRRRGGGHGRGDAAVQL